jgi:methionyl-tRNA formyltransferase
MTNVTILCTDPMHPVNTWLQVWKDEQPPEVCVLILRDLGDVGQGDFLFLISCHQIVPKVVRNRFRHTLVVHASALPEGRGMSPQVWQVVNGASKLTVTLLNAEDELDSGDIWHQIDFPLAGTELTLLTWALGECDRNVPRRQVGEPTYFRRRTPADSAIDPHRPLAEFFDLLRIADPNRYPAFFTYRGCTYRIRIEKQ